MGNCLKCNKKLGFWEGYSTFKGEFCNDCYGKKEGILKEVEPKKKKKINPKQYLKKNDLKIVIVIILIVLWGIFGWNPFSENNDEYSSCVDSCIYSNEFCADDFSEYVMGDWYLTVNDYDQCHDDLKYCLGNCV